MASFSKTELFTELKTIFLFEADHIAMGRSPEAAAQIVGFASDQYWRENPDRVELTPFQIAGTFDRGYDFAFAPSLTNTFGEHEVQDIKVFMLGTPLVGGQGGAGGETHAFMTPSGLCRTLADTVQARWKLEWNQAGDFTTRELALLANMSEGAVRNALADKASGLRAVPGKKPVAIAYEDASTWLAGRRGFRPSPTRPKDDPVLHDELRGLQTAHGLGNLINRQLRQRFENPDGAYSALGWPAPLVESWRNGEFAYDFDRAAGLARALDLDAPTFIGKCLELSLRRDEQNRGS